MLFLSFVISSSSGRRVEKSLELQIELDTAYFGTVFLPAPCLSPSVPTIISVDLSQSCQARLKPLDRYPDSIDFQNNEDFYSGFNRCKSGL